MSNKTASGFSRWMIAILAISIPAFAIAANFVPYPGKRMVRLMSVKEPNLIVVNFDTDMIGFFRTIQIKIPGIEVPKDSDEVNACERALAHQAMAFTRTYLASAKNIYVQDMLMQTSTDELAISPILTNQGNLGDELRERGFARSDSVAPEQPWCD